MDNVSPEIARAYFWCIETLFGPCLRRRRSGTKSFRFGKTQEKSCGSEGIGTKNVRFHQDAIYRKADISPDALSALNKISGAKYAAFRRIPRSVFTILAASKIADADEITGEEAAIASTEKRKVTKSCDYPLRPEGRVRVYERNR